MLQQKTMKYMYPVLYISRPLDTPSQKDTY